MAGRNVSGLNRRFPGTPAGGGLTICKRTLIGGG